ncbi:hypothetical protein AN958_02670 [Leucoagaricus sp. SymC.cos]|nr:hypothetical protein AN958_02670 [Leucoagaricus sp. SymC.cos]
MVQLFFSWRIWILTRNVIIAAVVVLLSLAAGACAIVTTYEITIIPEFVRYQEFKKHKTGFKSSDMVIDRIIRVTMQTGLLTSMLAIVDLIVYLADPTGTHLIFNFPLCKLYSNSLMSSLNSRGGWRYDSSVTSGVHFGLPDKPATSHAFDEMKSGWNDDNRMVSPSSPSGKAQNLFNNMKGGIIKKPEVFVHVESHEMHDIEAPSTKRSSSDVQ